MLKILLQYLLPQHLLSRFLGKLANCKIKPIKNFLIITLKKVYKIDLAEAVESNPLNYESFNAFFTRELKPDARSISKDINAIISPVDGKILQCGTIANKQLINAKGFDFTLSQLLGENELATPFANGDFAVLYLAPNNYHRIHMPLTGTLEKMLHIPGKLFSVDPKIVATIPNVLARNERVVNIFSTAIGPMAVIFVGAMIVGSIKTSWEGIVTPNTSKIISTWSYAGRNMQFITGQEIGQFLFGSTVIILFPPQKITWEKSIKAELPVKMGQKIAIV